MKFFFIITGMLCAFVACQFEENTQTIKSTNNKQNKIEIEFLSEETSTGGVVSGIYQNTFIAVEKENISGLYNTEKKLNNCQFYFKGQYNPETRNFNIQLRNLVDNEIIEGKLETIDGKVNIKTEVNFKSKCPDSISNNGLTLSFNKKSNWIKISPVLKENTEIFEEPDEGMGTGLKFKKNELLCILEEKNNWYRVESFGKTTNAGWIRKENID